MMYRGERKEEVSMHIRMYHCGFGDCFNLIDKYNNSLYVDFGIHRYSMDKAAKEAIYDRIINLMQGKDDFLLTHYHDDHYAGAIYMAKMKRQFRNVYIPDIWNINGSVQVVSLLLLRGLITKSELKKDLSIIRFLQEICCSKGRIYFVKRNTKIQQSYIALWPDEKYIEKRAKEIYQDLTYDREIIERLTELSEELRRLVLRMAEIDNPESRMEIRDVLEKLERNYKAMLPHFVKNQNLQCKLSKFGNNISIVFQNEKNEIERNILFTGDIGIWKYIESNKDQRIPMHSSYDVIKIPHHGTSRYYHDFHNKCDRDAKLLIPNGIIKNKWKIDRRYFSNARPLCTVTCAGNQACGAVSQCRCCRCSQYNLCNNANGYIDL